MTDTERRKTPKTDPDSRPDADRDTPERRPDADEDQVGILPGRVPGRPVTPEDPRFPGSQPDLA